MLRRVDLVSEVSRLGWGGWWDWGGCWEGSTEGGTEGALMS